MTLSFTAHWHDELPAFIPHSNQHRYKIHALSGITIGWQKSWPFRLSCFSVQERWRLGRRNAARRYATPGSGL
jgi:hypothetical protein